jgi:bla regulator protein BlaR1
MAAMTALSLAWIEIGRGAINHIWQSTLVAGVAWLITLALRRNHAAARHAVWLAASLKFLVPFALLVSAGSYVEWRPVDIPARPQVAFVMETIGQPFSAPSTGEVRAMPPAPRSAIALTSVLVGVWLVGVAAMLVIWCARWRRVSAIVRAGTPAREGPVVDALRRLEGIASGKRRLAVVVSDAPLEPGVFGILRPVLLWPRRMSEHLDDAHIEAILAHELSHVRRRDNLAAAAHMVVQAMFWFHPLVWWLGARLMDERERACDEDVVRLGNDPRTYAESILKTCQFFVAPSLACVAGVTGSDLKKRIEHIMINDSRAPLSPWKKALLALAATGAVAAPVGVGVLNAPRLRAQTPVGNERAAVPKIQTRLLVQQDATAKAAFAVRSQSPAATAVAQPAFDVTSVKPNNTGSGQIGMMPAGGGGWRGTNVTLGMLIRISSQLQDNQIIGGPNWLFSERFDVLGSGTAPGRDGTMFAKLQTLLADRFSLVTHTEKRELPVYKLSLVRRDGKIGPKMQLSTADCPVPPPPLGRGNPLPPGPMSPAQVQRCGMTIGPGRFAGGSVSMPQLAASLSRIVGSMVVDTTNLAGNFELTLEYAPDPNMGGRSDFQGLLPPLAPERPSIDGPSIFSALQEQLGLKLESTKGLVDVLVIDRAEKPTQD